MSFRLVLKLVTSSDLERRNGPYFALASRAHCVKAVEDNVVEDVHVRYMLSPVRLSSVCL